MFNDVERDKTDLVFVVTVAMTAETFVRKFATFVAESGYSVVVIASGVTPSTEIVGNGSIKIIDVHMEREPSPIKDLKSLFQLTKVLSKLKPRRLVYATPKASLLSSLSGVILRIPSRNYQLWGLRLETTSGLKRIVLGAFEKITSLCSTSIIANSRSLADQYLKLRLNARKKVEILGEGSSHGVDLAYFSPKVELPVPSGEWKQFLDEHCEYFKVGFIGRLHPDKGTDTLIEAAQAVAHSGTKIALVLVGGEEGANSQIPQTENLAVFKVGFVSDVRPYLQEIQVLTLPSLREGFPNVVLEAAAMEIPAIVSDGTGVRDSVIDAKTGIITRVGDSNSLATAIKMLSQNEKLRQEFGKNARQRAVKSFGQKDVWGRYFRFLFRES